LKTQINRAKLDGKVEILSLMDNKFCSIAAKRNSLLNMASGDYIGFLDDDDDISGNYLSSLLSAAEHKSDVITFNQHCMIDKIPLHVRFGLGNPHEGLIYDSGTNCYKPIKRPPYHVCFWKSALARSEQFRQVVTENGQSVEDIDWCRRLYPKCTSSSHIDETLHFYNYNSTTTASILK
jgi:glycosyltransferase involved in cell wall biosynthesis